jgi:HTH-type transcriptional regulator / antitoxin HipB
LEPLQLHTPVEIQRLLADRLRAARLESGLKQSTLAARAGVTLASLRRFEQSAQISLKHLLRVCHSLGRLDELSGLFLPPPARSIAELERLVDRPIRKRGSH